MTEPTMTEPTMTNAFNQTISAKSTWDAKTIEQFLGEARQPLRLATLSSRGFPQITSLWFAFDDGALWCCTQQQSLVSRHIQREPRVGFEIAVNDPPYRGVSGYGNAELSYGDATMLLDRLTTRHLSARDKKLKSWLMSRVATEVIIKIVPVHITSWDFSGRMSKVS